MLDIAPQLGIARLALLIPRIHDIKHSTWQITRRPTCLNFPQCTVLHHQLILDQIDAEVLLALSIALPYL